jgi:glycine/D-amino acid oxidase-like deaminating enzyme
MKKIVVIGAGVFGCEVSIQLSKLGFEVTLIEKEENILNGATSKSVLRLHLGFHYPRDLETAIQSRIGYINFLNRFPSSIDLNFENYYALAKEDSRVNEMQFLDFVEAAGLTLSRVPKEKLAEIGFNSSRAQAVYSNKEGVIDIPRLRVQMLSEMSQYGVRRIFKSEVISARMNLGKWIISDKKGLEEEFDFIVRATYGHDRMNISNQEISSNRKFEFHRTLVLKAELTIPRIGMTVIDGDFLTVLPQAREDSHLLYGPTPSVMERFVGSEYPASWDEAAPELISQNEAKLLSRYAEWFNNTDNVPIKERLVTVRAIDVGVQATDKRISQVNFRADKFLDIHSGKIDHCVEIAGEVASIITRLK